MTTKIKAGVIGDNVVGITQLNVSDGTNGQVLITDGSGTLSFTDMTGGVDGIVSSADATAITIDSSENVGIGVSPQKKLSIQGIDGASGLTEGNSRTALFIDNAGATYINLASSTSAQGGLLFSDADANNRGALVYEHANDAMTFDTASSERMRIDSSGNVGIGTTSPDMKLEVAGASGASSTFKLSGRPDWTSGNGQYNVGNIYGENLGAGVNTTRIKLDGDDTSGTIQFYTANSGTLRSAMIINSDQDITMSGTGSLKLPSGTTAQRPTGAEGMIRYNTTEDYIEYYNGDAWLATSETGLVASGGAESNVTISGIVYKLHTFTSSGTLTVSSGGYFDYLIISGGGGGGCGTAGGGGAGGYRTNVSGQSSGGGGSAEGTAQLSAGSHTITIGAGGAGAVTNSSDATNGGNTSVGSIVQASGGGAGGEGNPNNTRRAGQPGGSGGGAWEYSGDSGGAGSGTSGQGYAGGSSALTGGAGGGGAGGTAGAHSTNTQNSDGGPGVSSNINGTATGRAGGGGGGLSGQSSASDGGGAGANGSATGSSGTANTGGGGGGGWAYASGNGGSGGSGLVIIRYRV